MQEPKRLFLSWSHLSLFRHWNFAAKSIQSDCRHTIICHCLPASWWPTSDLWACHYYTV